MVAAGVVAVLGVAIGVVSRVVDTAPWAPGWAGNLLSPWLVSAWLAGATTRAPGPGAGRGLGLLAGVVAGYLATAGGDAGRLAPGLVGLALVAGPAIGSAAASWRRGSAWAISGPVVLGAILVAEGALLGVGPRSVGERLGFALEAAFGLVLAHRLGGLRAAVWTVPVAAGAVGLELFVIGQLGLTLA